MYKGQIIDELMAIVSSAEEHAFASPQLALQRTVASYSGFNTYLYELENLPLMAVGAA